MQDRMPGAPGQYKAILTADELKKMQAGEQFTITMIRDDRPIVKGTPYSKAAVLPDELAKKLCPDIQDPTPADAFAALVPLNGTGAMTGDLPMGGFRVTGVGAPEADGDAVNLGYANENFAPTGLHRSYGSLKDIGITTFPTTMATVASKMPANSMIVIDTRRINGTSDNSTETISDWGNTANGVAIIMKGYNTARVSMTISQGYTNATEAEFYFGNYASSANVVNWNSAVGHEVGLYKELWSGSWSSGTITVPNTDKYKAFLITMSGVGTLIIAFEHNNHIRGIGGYVANNPITAMTYHFSASISGDDWTLDGCTGIDHPGGTNTSKVITQIIGLL